MSPPDAEIAPPERLSIRVRGIVQGVGFRPHVHRLARRHAIHGYVLNDAEGVLIEAEGEGLDAFVAALTREAPPLAKIEDVDARRMPPRCEKTGFAIRESQAGDVVRAAVPADAAICGDCLEELFDPTDRRYLHPFISCSHCGPRYTITRGLPYDRAQTALARFGLCPECGAEYRDPADRRFHAEPVSCNHCGPRLLTPIDEIAAKIRAGGIVALKGLGGFHLVCDARDPRAIAALRARKRRDGKPFAVMPLNLASAERLAEIDDDALRLFIGPERPVVVLPAKPDNGLALGVANGLPSIGLLLPYTPVHYLLFHALLGSPAGRDWLDEPTDIALVATSANLSGEPLVIDELEAEERLAGIADLIAGHDREILVRADDSVVRADGPDTTMLRRARGYVPRPIRLPAEQPAVLALGAHLKTTVTLTHGATATVSQHVGDLDTPGAQGFLCETIDHLMRITRATPDRIACDLHPDFASTRLAHDLSERMGAPVVPVQHHHAHIAAVLGKHGARGPALGLALDGYGMGPGGEAWGGELLRVDGARYDRLGHLAEIATPGGDVAAREPWRMAAAAFHRIGRAGQIDARFSDEPQAVGVTQLLARGLAPATSSCGRWFDAAAGVLGLVRRSAFEGEAAMRLEGLVDRPVALEGGWRIVDGVLDLDPLFEALSDRPDARAGAALFHGTLAAGLADLTIRAADETGLRTVALSGGCFLNRVLAQDLVARLAAAGLSPLLARDLPPNDGGLSFGQAVVAGAAEGV